MIERSQSVMDCALFDGVSGKLVVLTLTGGAFLTYVGMFWRRKRRGSDRRTWLVFWLDLAKMGFGQTIAYGINVLNSPRNARGPGFDATSWSFPTCLNDELIRTTRSPHMALVLAHCPCAQCIVVCKLELCASPPRFWEVCARGRGRRRRFGGAVQLVDDSTCVLGVCCRRITPARWPRRADDGSHTRRRFTLLPMRLMDLRPAVDVRSEAWTFAGFFRIAIDVLQLFFVDHFNKWHARRAALMASDAANAPSPGSVGAVGTILATSGTMCGLSISSSSLYE